MFISSVVPFTTRVQLLLGILSGGVVISRNMVGGYTIVGSVMKVGQVQGSTASN